MKKNLSIQGMPPFDLQTGPANGDLGVQIHWPFLTHRLRVPTGWEGWSLLLRAISLAPGVWLALALQCLFSPGACDHRVAARDTWILDMYMDGSMDAWCSYG